MSSVLFTIVLLSLSRALADDWYGVDITSNIKQDLSVRVKARPGENLQMLVDQFYTKHGDDFIQNNDDYIAMLIALEEAAGGKCDACKTFVELLTEELKEMGRKHAKQDGNDQFGQAKKSMHVDGDMESALLQSLCKGAAYLPYADHIKKGCADLLNANGTHILRVFSGGKLRAEDTVNRKHTICAEMMQVCPVVKPPKKVSKCRACAEAMQDLHFLLRRSINLLWSKTTDGPNGHSSPALRDAKGIQHRFSRKHIIIEIQELCYDMENRHPPAVAAEVQEVCEQLVEDYQEDIVKYFAPYQQGSAIGHQHPNPARAVCVESAKMCKPNQFDKFYESLSSYVYNFTSRNIKTSAPDRKSVV